MSFICIVVAVVAAGFLTEMVAASTAPLGYQDEFGFHFGRPTVARPSVYDIENPS